MSELAGRRALITGASSGIGLALAEALAAAGMHLTLVARDQSRLEEARARLAATARVDIKLLALDLDQPAAGLEAELAAVDLTGLAVLVHSAGAYAATAVLDSNPAELESMLRVNTSSLLVLAQCCAEELARNAGQVVVVNSSAARQQARAQTGAYATSKHATSALSDALRDDFNPRGVRVLSVYPGRTATPMQEAIFADEQRDYPAERLLQAADIAAVVMHSLQLPRTAEVTDIAIRPFLKT